MAYAPSGQEPGAVMDFPVLQFQRPGELQEQSLLPSALYAPLQEEKASLHLPWSQEPQWVIGSYARLRGSKVSGRLITSAKSWLCHHAVDRSAAILPWGGAADVPKLSPVHASALLLGQMRDAWNHAHSEHRLEAQEVAVA